MKKRIDKIEEILEQLGKEVTVLNRNLNREVTILNRNLNREITNLNKEVSHLTGSWGRFVEGLVEPSAINFAKKKWGKVIEIHPRLKISRNGKNAEYDLVIVSEKEFMFLVSAKANVSSQDIDELLFDMDNFFYFLGRYKGYKLAGAIAGMGFGKGVDKYAYKKGLIVMKPANDVMKIIQPKNMKFVK
jgi:hypothetical protein